MTIPITTSRFIIRNFLPKEEHLYLDLLSDPEVALYLPKRTLEEHQQIFKTALNEYATGDVLGRWGIFNLADQDFIGMCLLRPFNENGLVEIGYSLHQKYWGSGLATEMAEVLIAYAFESTHAKEVVAVTAPENIASQHVLEKAGLQRKGTINRNDTEVPYFSRVKLEAFKETD